MPDDEQAQDAVDVQPDQGPQERIKGVGRGFPWIVLVAGIVASAVIMAAITISTIPLSGLTVREEYKR
jgi:hypothetical protein